MKWVKIIYSHFQAMRILNHQMKTVNLQFAVILVPTSGKKGKGYLRVQCKDWNEDPEPLVRHVVKDCMNSASICINDLSNGLRGSRTFTPLRLFFLF